MIVRDDWGIAHIYGKTDADTVFGTMYAQAAECGCAVRVVSQVLAYEGYWPPAWSALPWSAICELTAVTVFAANLLLTFKQAPAHMMNAVNAA